jgi:predicted transposase/invertase (TIGR01784 family)
MGITDEKGFLEARYNKGRAEGLAEGRAEGRAEGKEEANRDNARKMKELGMAADVISQVTGLQEEEIKVL